MLTFELTFLQKQLIRMEAPRKGRFQNLKHKALKKMRVRRNKRAAHVNENQTGQPPPTSAHGEISEDSELSSTANSSSDKTVDLPKPQEDEDSTTSEEALQPATVG